MRRPSLFLRLLTLGISLSQAQVVIPQPKGDYAVTLTTAKLVDSSRIDPYDPNSAQRAVMVSLFYPVPRDTCQKTCTIDYMPPRTAAAMDAALAPQRFPNGTFEAVKFQVCCSVTGQIPQPSDIPLTLFSPGYTASRFVYNILAETVASKGYAVATIDHPYDAVIVEYPDGEYVLAGNVSFETPALEKAVNVRVDDGHFVLSQLGNETVVKDLVPGASCAFDVNKAVLWGHSLGGATAISALSKNESLLGAINIDGKQFDLTSDINKPAFLVSSSTHNRSNDDTWAAAWEHLKAWRREISVNETLHLTFTDAPIIMPSTGMSNQTIRAVIGALEPQRAWEIITTYVVAFFDFVLKVKEEKILDGASKEYPEVYFWP